MLRYVPQQPCAYGGTTPTCWVGDTTDQSICNNVSGYSGCNRTLCNWFAGNLICAHNGMKLPTNHEFQLLRTDYNNPSAANDKFHQLDFCNADYPNHSSCSYINNMCFGSIHPDRSYPNTCNVRTVATNENSYQAKPSYVCKNDPNGANTKKMTTSIRCAFSCPEHFGAACNSCTLSACTGCKDGYYLNNGSCVACSAANCKTCPNNTCTQCTQNYEPDGSGGCKQSILTVQVNNKTWTKRNPGDVGGPQIPSNVFIYNIGNGTCTKNGAAYSDVNCKNSGQAICWTGGITSGNYQNRTTSYNTSNRTICNWFAGMTICPNYGMRMPTTDELLTLGASAFNYLDQCSGMWTNNTPICEVNGNCPGAGWNGGGASPGNRCQPARILSSNYWDAGGEAQWKMGVVFNNAGNIQLGGGWGQGEQGWQCQRGAGSVRCVSP